jgi:hypothetical protein
MRPLNGPRLVSTAAHPSPLASPSRETGSGVLKPPFFSEPVLSKNAPHEIPFDGRGPAGQTTSYRGFITAGVVDQDQQNLNDGFERYLDIGVGWENHVTLLPLGLARLLLSMQVKIDTADFFTGDLTSIKENRQHILHAYAQELLKVSLAVSRSGLPHQSSHRVRQRSVPWKTDFIMRP